MMILDAHCHLELFDKMPKVIPNELSLITMTNTLKTVPKNEEIFGFINDIYIAVGLHPQLINSRMKELEYLLELIDTHKFIGEIGIDGESSKIDEQIYVFSEIITYVDNLGDRVVSIHSKKADKLVIELLSGLISRNDNIYILHWYTGSQSNLNKAIGLGCHFSVNLKMCYSKKGMDIVKKIPKDRLLVETDAPFSEKFDSLLELKKNLLNTVKKIEDIRGEKLLEIISRNSEKIVKDSKDINL